MTLLQNSELEYRHVEVFTNYCIEARAAYMHLKTIENNLEVVGVLKEKCPVFLGDLNKMMIEHVLLSSARLLDPASQGQNKNLTVHFFLTGFDERVQTQLKTIYEGMGGFPKIIREARNKLIAHLDILAVSGDAGLGAASESEWENFWRQLDLFVNVLHTQFGRPEFFISDVGSISDADSFVRLVNKQAKREKENA